MEFEPERESVQPHGNLEFPERDVLSPLTDTSSETIPSNRPTEAEEAPDPALAEADRLMDLANSASLDELSYSESDFESFPALEPSAYADSKPLAEPFSHSPEPLTDTSLLYDAPQESRYGVYPSPEFDSMPEKSIYPSALEDTSTELPPSSLKPAAGPTEDDWDWDQAESLSSRKRGPQDNLWHIKINNLPILSAPLPSKPEPKTAAAPQPDSLSDTVADSSPERIAPEALETDTRIEASPMAYPASSSEGQDASDAASTEIEEGALTKRLLEKLQQQRSPEPGGFSPLRAAALSEGKDNPFHDSADFLTESLASFEDHPSPANPPESSPGPVTEVSETGLSDPADTLMIDTLTELSFYDAPQTAEYRSPFDRNTDESHQTAELTEASLTFPAAPLQPEPSAPSIEATEAEPPAEFLSENLLSQLSLISESPGDAEEPMFGLYGDPDSDLTALQSLESASSSVPYPLEAPAPLHADAAAEEDLSWHPDMPLEEDESDFYPPKTEEQGLKVSAETEEDLSWLQNLLSEAEVLPDTEHTDTDEDASPPNANFLLAPNALDADLSTFGPPPLHLLPDDNLSEISDLSDNMAPLASDLSLEMDWEDSSLLPLETENTILPAFELHPDPVLRGASSPEELTPETESATLTVPAPHSETAEMEPVVSSPEAEDPYAYLYELADSAAESASSDATNTSSPQNTAPRATFSTPTQELSLEEPSDVDNAPLLDALYHSPEYGAEPLSEMAELVMEPHQPDLPIYNLDDPHQAEPGSPPLSIENWTQERNQHSQQSLERTFAESRKLLNAQYGTEEESSGLAATPDLEASPTEQAAAPLSPPAMSLENPSLEAAHPTLSEADSEPFQLEDFHFDLDDAAVGFGPVDDAAAETGLSFSLPDESLLTPAITPLDAVEPSQTAEPDFLLPLGSNAADALLDFNLSELPASGSHDAATSLEFPAPTFSEDTMALPDPDILPPDTSWMDLDLGETLDSLKNIPDLANMTELSALEELSKPLDLSQHSHHLPEPDPGTALDDMDLSAFHLELPPDLAEAVPAPQTASATGQPLEKALPASQNLPPNASTELLSEALIMDFSLDLPSELDFPEPQATAPVPQAARADASSAPSSAPVTEPQPDSEASLADSAATDAAGFQIGEAVYHQRYGQGTVKRVITMNEDQIILNINFEGVGKRLLDPRLTQLEKVG